MAHLRKAGGFVDLVALDGERHPQMRRQLVDGERVDRDQNSTAAVQFPLQPFQQRLPCRIRRGVGEAAANAPARAEAGRQASGRITPPAEPKAAPREAAKDQLRLSRPDDAKKGGRAAAVANGDDIAAKDKALKEAATRLDIDEADMKAAFPRGMADALLFKVIATVALDVPVGTVDDWAWQGPTPAFAAIAARMGVPDLVERANRVHARTR